MGLEAATYVNDLTATNPLSTDKRKQGDDHLRLIKSVLKATFPNSDRPFYFDSYEAITGNHTVDAADQNRVFGASSTGGAFTVTLPTDLGASLDGFRVSIVKLETNANRVTVAPNSGTINGVASLSITNVGDRIDAIWTGAEWVGVVTIAGIDRVAITTDTTVDASHFDKLLDVVPASANLTLTLPAVALYLGRTLRVKLNSATYTCTLTPNGAETIDGASTWLLESQYDSVLLLAVSGGWFVLGSQTAQSVIPVASGMDYWGSTAPAGWLLCYGQAVSRTTYARLFAKISTTYGAGDGTTTFNLPDKRGRVTAGKDDMGGSSAGRLTDQAGGLDGDVLGDTGGSETHALSIAELADHGHPMRLAIQSASTASSATSGGLLMDTAGATSYSAYNGAVSNTAGQQIGGTGDGTAHNNVQPTIIANYIIKY